MFRQFKEKYKNWLRLKLKSAMMKIEIKTQDQTLSKNNNPGLVFY